MNEIIEALRFSSPILMQLICILLLIRCYRFNKEASRMKLTILLIATKVCSIMIWLGILFHSYAPGFFVHVHCVFYLSLLFNNIFFFHFLHTLTQTDKQRRFSWLHYAIPLLIVTVLAVWSLFVPFDVQLYIVTHGGEKAEGYELFSVLFLSKMTVNAVYYIFYMILEFIRLYRYRKAVDDYSADTGNTSMEWLYIFMFTSVLAIPITAGAAIISQENILSSVFIIIPILLVMFQGVIITFNMIVGKYVIIYNDNKVFLNTDNIKGKDIIQELENYMSTYKPYLNSTLRISDLSSVIGINRSKLSQLINQHYNMNFSCWINSYRLHEFETLTEKSDIDKYDLALSVGFSDYRAYLRIKKKRDA